MLIEKKRKADASSSQRKHKRLKQYLKSKHIFCCHKWIQVFLLAWVFIVFLFLELYFVLHLCKVFNQIFYFPKT